MSPDEIPIALEPFNQVENTITKRYAGTGLGLTIARRLVELHGGVLAVTSVKGQGTTITIDLPAERLVLSLAEVGPAVPATRTSSRKQRLRRSV